MKINYEPTKCRFDLLKAGDCFSLAGTSRLWIVICDEGNLAAASLDSGVVQQPYADTAVEYQPNAVVWVE